MSTKKNETTKRRKRRVYHIPLSDAERTRIAPPVNEQDSVFRKQLKKRHRRTRIRHIELPSGPRVEN